MAMPINGDLESSSSVGISQNFGSMSEDSLLNSLFESKKPADVIEFYNKFSDVEDLVNWMKNRPARDCRIQEVNGDTETIVVILTTDSDSDRSLRCRNEIFSGMHIVYVVDQRDSDGYLSLARNVNMGLRRASALSPRWIVFSNDDMYRIDGPEVLTRQLASISDQKVTAVFTQPARYHSVIYQLASSSIIRRSLLSLTKDGRNTLQRERKFSIDRFANPGTGLFWRAMYKASFFFRMTCDFGIIRSEYVREMQGRVFDETYGTALEDVDFSIRIAAAEASGEISTATINYLIGDEVGGTMGVDLSRSLRNLAGEAYLNFKIRNGLLETPHRNGI